MLEKEFFIENRHKLMDAMHNNSVVILFSGVAPKKSADELYPFTPNRNFYYMTGIEETGLAYMLSKENETTEEMLLIKRPDPIRAKWTGKTIEENAAKAISGINKVGYIEDLCAKLNVKLGNGKIQNLYLDLERDSWIDGETATQVFAKECTSKYPYIQIKNIYPTIADFRTIKSKAEIEVVKEAIRITKEGIQALMENARTGIKECALEACFDFVLKSNGITDYAFKTIAASGENATVLHYDKNNSMLKEGNLILFDLGAQYAYYNADISRTFPINGKFTERQKLFYNIVLKAQTAVIEAIKPGIAYSRLNEIVKEIYAKELKAIGLITKDEEVANYYYHGVSHSLGLDTHDVGDIKKPLEVGMLLTVEPGLYIAEEGIGIRIEDDVWVTKEGCEVLSKDIIKTADEIEQFMYK